MDEVGKQKKAIADRLRMAREIAGLSQGQVAMMLKVHRPTLSEIEAGRRNVTADELRTFSKIYDVSITWLVGNTEETDLQRDRIELAARELSKLKPVDLEKLLDLLSTLRNNQGPEE